MKTRTKMTLILCSLLPLCASGVQAENIVLKITKRYLNFPVSHGQERGRMTFETEGEPALSVAIRLAPEEADYWLFRDVSALEGKTVRIAYDLSLIHI